MFSASRLAVVLLVAASAQAGILVLRSDGGLQFVDATTLSIAGHDKVLSLGAQPALSGPINKLPQIKITGTILKSGDNRALAIYSAGGMQFFIPDGLPKTTPNDVASIWQMSRIAYKKSANDKVPTEVPVAQFIGFLPGGVDELAHLCGDAAGLEFIGGKGKTFATQLEFQSAAAKAFGSDPAMARLERSVAEEMRKRLDSFNSGNAGVEALDEGLQFAKLSLAAYPAVAEQKELRDNLQSKREWLDRKRAILRAFQAAGEWDGFLLADRDIEKYRAAFRDMAPMHIEALKASLALHQKAGEELNKDQEYEAAWREFVKASSRKPSDSVLHTYVTAAWQNYSSQLAKDHQGLRTNLNPGQRSAIAQDLQLARSYLDTAKKPARALEEVQKAEGIDAYDLNVLLLKAEVLGALGEYRQALATVDEYDKRAVDEDRARSEKLRADLSFKIDNTLDDMKTQVKKEVAAFNFHHAAELEKQGLAANPDDPELLIYSARTSLVLRDPKSARGALQHYLEVTTNLDASDKDRDNVRQMLASIHDAAPTNGGQQNWLSGRRQPAGAMYDPASGVFQPRIERIAASNKMTVMFEWDADRLKTITPMFEKDVHVSGEQKIYFGYDGPDSGVSWAGATPDPRGALPTDADELFRRAMVRLANCPYADPMAIQKLGGQNLALGIAGNRFFDPFVWDKVHYFQLSYDDRGYLKQAREIADPKAAPGDQWLNFEWDGVRLSAVRGYQGSDPSHLTKIYERTLQYQGNLLVSEEVQLNGKTSRIRYTYNGGRLVSAIADKDTLDERSRQVTFK